MESVLKKFTLIELLVVITVIAILASLLLPSLHGARKMARRAACVNNLRQLGLTFAVYDGDYGQLPPGSYFTGTMIIRNGVSRILHDDYGTKRELTVCPEGVKCRSYGNRPWPHNTGDAVLSYWYFGGNGGYPYNQITAPYGWLLSKYNSRSKGIKPSLKLAQHAETASQCMLAGDIAYTGPAPMDPADSYAYRPGRSNHPDTDDSRGRGVNNLYLDGRVSWLSMRNGVRQGNIFWDSGNIVIYND